MSPWSPVARPFPPAARRPASTRRRPAATPPPKPKPGGGWWAGAAAVVVLALAGGFLIGKSAGESSKEDDYKAGASGYQAIYDKGYAEGQSEGEEAGTSAGEQAGKEEGAKAGFEKGKAQGEAEGTAAGAKAALGGLTDWDTNAHYIIRVAGRPVRRDPLRHLDAHRDAGRRQLRALPERPDGRLRQAREQFVDERVAAAGRRRARRPYRPRPLRKRPARCSSGPISVRTSERPARSSGSPTSTGRHRVLEVGERLVGVERRLDGRLDEALRARGTARPAPRG